MAKKQETKIEVEEPQIEEIVVETAPVVEQPKTRERVKPKDEWEIKDRIYLLKDGKKPLSRSIKSANIYYFDEEKGYERELKYCQNQKTPFVDEMKGDQRLEHIVFRSGSLFVEKEKTTLQKLLSLYHPHRDQIYEEYKPAKLAEDEIDILEMQVDALTAARNIDIDMAEAIMRVEKGYEREIKYCENQRTPFVDEMKGDQRLSHIIFRSGALFVPKNKTVLQKMLSLYHPHKDKIYYEWQPAKKAADQIEVLNLEVDALVAARSVEIDMAEAIMRAEVGSKVDTLSSKELRRDLLVFAKKNPKLFLELADDENVMLRNFGIKAVEDGILRLSSDQRNFLWGSNGRKLMVIPFDEHPYTALAHWFKTDEGMEIYSNIEKRLNQ